MEPLENILSGRGEAMPQSEVTEQPAQQQEPQAAQQPQAQPDPDEPEAFDVGGQKMVPQQALHAQREKVKRYTEQVADFERKLTEQNEAWERRFGQLLNTVRQPPAQQEQPKEPDWFENPTEAARNAVAPQFGQVEQMLMANSRLIAEAKFGDDKVKGAEEAFIAAVQRNALDPADYQRVVNSPNRYAAAVQWHQRQQAQAEIGDDPAAFKAKVEAELREKLLAELQQGGAPQSQQPAPVMPSNLAAVRNVGNRSGPAWGGPQPTESIFATNRAARGVR